MPEPSPDQLLKMLDTELARNRSRRAESDNRDAFRIWSIVLIVGGAILALAVLQFFLSQMTPPRRIPAAPPVTAPAGVR